jgi:hypothetical protein
MKIEKRAITEHDMARRYITRILKDKEIVWINKKLLLLRR